MESKIQELINTKLINSEQATEMNELLSETEQITNGQFIYALFQAEFKKATGHQYSILTTIIDSENEKIEANVQAEINDSILTYLDKLKKVDLINSRQFQEQSDKVKNNDYTYLFQFLMGLTSQVNFEEWISQKNLEDYRHKLLESKIISKEENDRLKKDIKEDKIKSPYQLINYCEKARFFDLSKYSNNPKVYLLQIHKVTSEILPELSFSDFRFEIEKNSEESFGDYISYNLITSIKSNGKTYKQKSFISPENIGENNYYLGKIEDYQYFQIFNKILKDLESPYRLHCIKSSYSHQQENVDQYFGVIALKRNQLEMFRYSNSYWDLSYESFKNPLTTKKINKAIEEYQELGLLNHLDNDQLNKSIERVKEKETRNLNDVLISFPDVILSFDLELVNLENPYEEIVSEYSKISRQDFNPINIKDNFDLQKEKVSLTFDFNNKTYETEFNINRDWIDTRFFEYINQVIAENKLSGQFYSLYGDGAVLIYLTPEQYKHIRENKLLVFADEWESQRDE